MNFILIVGSLGFTVTLLLEMKNTSQVPEVQMGSHTVQLCPE